ncbi:MAG: hypothetical protein H6744_10440 [Deltaproteobacteria bacterium]|nr:hypothetical protein [Deltaproteobacteria bacterium]
MRAVYWLLFGGCFVGVYFAFRTWSDDTVALTIACTLCGMAATLFASLAVAASDSTLHRLAKVPEIKSLIEMADTEERRLSTIRSAMGELDKIIARESRRLFILKRMKEIEGHLVATADEYEKLAQELEENERALQVDPEFESKVRRLVAYIRAKEALREDMLTFRTGNAFVDFALNVARRVIRG